ncbi:MAG TPA: MFS transporter [Myxococcaceae bacterium]|nr:MFS transporter [Myxococcaceae bacterium]
MPDTPPHDAPDLRFGSPGARWLLLTTVLGSGMALLDSTVVNVALPALTADLGAGVIGLQWILNGYLLTLSAFLLVGGSLGDRHGRRRIFSFGVILFTAASLLCALAPNTGTLIAARALQGLGGALLVPGSLALIQSSFLPKERGKAVGLWSGMSGVAAAIGPLFGGWLVGSLGWRWVFLINLPIGALVLLAARHVPERRAPKQEGGVDHLGALLAVLALGGICLALIDAGATGSSLRVWAAAIVGVVSLMAFVVVERRARAPMLPMRLFRSRDFSVANVVTLLAYAALGGLMLFLVLYLQVVAGFTPLQAGMALLPVSALMLVLSPGAGALTDRLGPRWVMAAGCTVAGAGTLLLSRLTPQLSVWRDLVPAVVLFALGLCFVATPVTVTVLSSVSSSHAGIASGINNAVARTASLLAVAALPLVSGLSRQGMTFLPQAYPRAMVLCALLLFLSAGLSLALSRRQRVPG